MLNRVTERLILQCVCKHMRGRVQESSFMHFSVEHLSWNFACQEAQIRLCNFIACIIQQNPNALNIPRSDVEHKRSLNYQTANCFINFSSSSSRQSWQWRSATSDQRRREVLRLYAPRRRSWRASNWRRRQLPTRGQNWGGVRLKLRYLRSYSSFLDASDDWLLLSLTSADATLL